jgi:hypothetical protein
MCEFNALTCIDTTSNLVELIRIDNKTAEHIRDKFVQSWLCRYPRPNLGQFLFLAAATLGTLSTIILAIGSALGPWPLTLFFLIGLLCLP